MKPVEWAKHVAVFVAAVFLIWLGGVMIAFGGLLSLLGRLRRERRVAPMREATI